MAPVPAAGKTSARQFQPRLNAQKSGVLALLHPSNQFNSHVASLSWRQINLIITHRSEDIDHSGQLSFPGGKSGPRETAVETALREAQEEIGIDPDRVSILGKLSGLYISKSNNFVHPVVGWIPQAPHLKINPLEVQEAFSVALPQLLNDELMEREYWKIHNYGLHVPFWAIHDVPLWGATAMMTSELVSLCEDYLDQESYFELQE
jgi:8-oxo-dGTP pyrophosphatase MutT (NUDIX family)